MSITYNHVQLSFVDSNANVRVFYPKNTGSDVSIDRSNNSNIPSDVTNAQELANKLAVSAFVNPIDDTTISTSKTYSSNKINTLNNNTYHLDDSTKNDITDNDSVPILDSSNSTGKRTLWSTIIAKIKSVLTKSDVGLSNVENKSSATIRSELTKANVTTALGYTPPTADTNTWRGIQDNLTSTSTTDSLSANQGKVLKGLVDGKAASSHTHAWSDITSGIPNTTLATDSGTATINLTANTTYKLTAAGKSVIFKTPTDANSDHYTSAYCNTDGATAAKVASCSNYALRDQNWIQVLIKNSNTVQGAITLNINSTGAKPIGINGSASSASNYTLPAGSYIVVYGSGTYWFRTDGKLPGSISGNAVNVTGTVAIANGGTGATTRLAAAKALTNESVGSSANYFVTLTTNWGKFGYTSVADAKSALGISVTNKAATLSWGSAVTVATVCGTNVTAKLPSNPNTDTKVTQGSTNTLNWRKVVLGYQDSSSAGSAVTEQTNQVYGTPNIEAQSQTGFLRFKGMSTLITGSGTAGSDKGSGVSPRYFPAKWTFNLGRDAANGDVIFIKMPNGGHDYGVFVSIDNGSHYRPVCLNTTDRLTTHFGSGQMLMLMYDSAAVTNSVYAAAGADTRSNITGSWRVVNYRDTNSTYSIITWSGGNGPTVSSFVQNTAKGTLMSIFRFRDDNNIFGLGASGWVKGWVIYQNAHNSAYDVEGFGMVWSNSKGERRYRFHVGGQEKNSSAYFINRVFQDIMPEITPSLTKTLSTSASTTFTFSNSLITTSSTVDVYTSIWGVNPTSVTVSAGSVSVVIPKYTSAASLTVKLHIYNY